MRYTLALLLASCAAAPDPGGVRELRGRRADRLIVVGASDAAPLRRIERELASMGAHENTFVFVLADDAVRYARTAPGRLIAMIALEGGPAVGGVGTGEGFEAMARDAGAPEIEAEPGPLAAAFYEKDVPVLSVGDITLAVELARRIDGLPEPPAFRRIRRHEDEPRTMVKLDTMPDYTFDGEGVLFGGVREDGAGYAGGMRAGDVLVELDGEKIGNVEEYTQLLHDLKLNEAVPFVVLRDGERVTGTVTPTSRW